MRKEENEEMSGEEMSGEVIRSSGNWFEFLNSGVPEFSPLVSFLLCFFWFFFSEFPEFPDLKILFVLFVLFVVPQAFLRFSVIGLIVCRGFQGRLWRCGRRGDLRWVVLGRHRQMCVLCFYELMGANDRLWI